MAPRTKAHSLRFPLTADQVEKLDSMLQTLFEELRNNGIFPFTDDGDLLTFEDGELARIAIGANHLVLISDGDMADWGLVDLVNSITGVLTVVHGGTGVASFTAYAPVLGGTTATGALQSAGIGTAGQVFTSNGAGAAPTFQTASAASTGYWSPLTNGDPTAPELIFDASGDAIAVFTALP